MTNLPINLLQAAFSRRTLAALEDEKTFERAVQTYTWMMPALNMYGMMDGSEKVFGKGYNVLPIWKDRLNAKTLITTPNSDVIYAMGYVDLKDDGPLVILSLSMTSAGVALGATMPNKPSAS